MDLPVAEEKYNLKWNSHHSIIANNVEEHLAGEQLVDVTLSCEGKFIRAHKLILSASSQYFKELFQLHQGPNPIIIMMNAKFEYVQYIIDYVYKGEVKLLSSEIEGILKLANDLQIKGLHGVLNKKFESLLDEKTNESTQKNGKRKDEVQSNNSVSNAPVIEPSASKNSVPKSVIIFGEEPNVNKKLNCKERQAMQIGKKWKSEKCNIPKRRKVSESPNNKKEKQRSECYRPILPRPDKNIDLAKAKDFKISPQIQTKEPDPPNVPYKVVTRPEILSQCSTKPIDILIRPLQGAVNSTDIANGRSQSATDSTDTSRASTPLLEVVVKEDLEKFTTTDENHDTRSCNSNITKSVDGLPKPVKRISAFMLFTEEFRPKISLQHPDENVKQISLRLSMMWKDLPVVKKDSYYEAASKMNGKLRQN